MEGRLHHCTVRTAVLLVTLPEVAVMLAVPVFTVLAVAKPSLPDVLLMVATLVLSEFQVTCVVMSLLSAGSAKVPCALNC